MSKYLVWIKSKKQKCELQCWFIKPDPKKVVRYMVVDEADVKDMTLKELEAKYGSVYHSDTVE